MSAGPRTLSSGWTFWMKFIMPVLWIGIFSTITLGMVLSPDSWKDRNGQPPSPVMRWIFLGVVFGGAWLFVWLCVRLKRVRMDDRSLYVSNFRTEIVVPLANVSDVTENRWVNAHPVTIHLHADTEFGSRVMFMPKHRWIEWTPHPVVEEIRAAVRRATGQEGSPATTVNGARLDR